MLMTIHFYTRATEKNPDPKEVTRGPYPDVLMGPTGSLSTSSHQPEDYVAYFDTDFGCWYVQGEDDWFIRTEVKPVLDLRDDEIEALQDDQRCAYCTHLFVFHRDIGGPVGCDLCDCKH